MVTGLHFHSWKPCLCLYSNRCSALQQCPFWYWYW